MTKDAAHMALRAGFAYALHISPYLGKALRAIRAYPSSDIPTLAVHVNWVMLWNPHYVMNLPPSSVAAVLLHETHHLIRQHPQRWKHLQQPDDVAPLWNVATDAHINHDLHLSDIIMPGKPVTFDTIHAAGVEPGNTSEETFRALLTAPSPLTNLACSSPAPFGQPADREGFTYAEQDLLLRQVAADITTYSHHHTIPQGLRRWVENTSATSHINWAQKLRTALSRDMGRLAGRTDFSYARMSRRQHLIPHVVLPGMTAAPPAVIDIIVDTSGSINDRQLQQAISEITGIARSHAAHHPLRIRWCDSAVSRSTIITHTAAAHQLHQHIIGGGDTDLRVALHAAAHDRPRSSIVVTITDGKTEWPDTPPQPHTFYIAAIHQQSSAYTPPSWMTTITIPTDLPAHA